jgi:hypothetical protein
MSQMIYLSATKAKEIVRSKDNKAWLSNPQTIGNKNLFTIRGNNQSVFGRGKTPAQAWKDAAIKVMAMVAEENEANSQEVTGKSKWFKVILSGRYSQITEYRCEDKSSALEKAKQELQENRDYLSAKIIEVSEKVIKEFKVEVTRKII